MLILLFVSIAFHSSPLLGDADTIESADSATMVAESAVKPDVSTSGDEDQTEVVADLEQPWSLPDITHRYFSKISKGCLMQSILSSVMTEFLKRRAEPMSSCAAV